MKKVILGAMIMLSGIISIAILLAGTMATGFVHDGEYSFVWSLSQYKLTTPCIVFGIIAVLGFLLCLWGLMEKKDR